MGSVCSRGSRKRRSPTSGVAEGDRGSGGALLKSTHAHSRSAPQLLPKQPPGTTEQALDSSETQHVQEMIRQFTRKSLSLEAPGSDIQAAPPTGGRRGPRRDSRIDDRDVLQLVASRSRPQVDEEFKEIKQLAEKAAHGADLDLGAAPPEIAARVQRRRQTMEKLDVFSPDAAPERLEELYEATERVIAKEDREAAVRRASNAGQPLSKQSSFEQPLAGQPRIKR